MSAVSAGKDNWLPGTDREHKSPEDVMSEVFDAPNGGVATLAAIRG